VLASAMALTACSGGSGGSGGSSATAAVDKNVDGKGKTITLWHFEDATAATAISWDEAIKVFEKETGAKVKFENKSFEQIRQSASQILNSDQAPDVMEYPKGNGTAGLLSSQGLLTNIDSAVSTYGWDKLITGGLATTGKYDAKGVMGSGHWYGVSDYGEFVQVYYNKDEFAKYNIPVPTTFAEFEAALATFKNAGVTPLAEAGGEYPIQQLMYQLALSKADRAWVDSYQLYKGKVDWQGPEWTFAADTLKDWVDKGYISKDATALKAQDMENQFVAGTSPIMVSGSWWQGTLVSDVTFNWGTFLFPSKLAMGSGGNLWVVPTKSKNADLAYKFIDITLRPEIQNILGNKGSIPVNAEPSAITDEKSKELIANFTTLTDRDALSFYPDWPTPTFYDQLVAGTQELVNGTKSPADALKALGTEYQTGVDAITNQ
jgi:raffinose/stachyose/melibiose transport system substrate-binding protein